MTVQLQWIINFVVTLWHLHFTAVRYLIMYPVHHYLYYNMDCNSCAADTNYFRWIVPTTIDSNFCDRCVNGHEKRNQARVLLGCDRQTRQMRWKVQEKSSCLKFLWWVGFEVLKKFFFVTHWVPKSLLGLVWTFQDACSNLIDANFGAGRQFKSN